MPKRSVIRTPLLMAGGLAVFLVQPASGLHAQSVEEDLIGLALENAVGYLEPLTFGLGYAMNGGLFDSAAPMRRFGFEVGARAMAAFPSRASETFDAVLPSQITFSHPNFSGGARSYDDPYRSQNGSPSTPTAVGRGPGVILTPHGQFRDDLIGVGADPEAYNLHFPRGGNIPAIPFVVGHGSFGLGWGTDVTVRLMPEVELDEEIGGVSALGFGVKHAVTNWFTAPVDVSVAYGRQRVKVGSYVDGSSNQYGVLVGKGFGPLSLHGSGMLRDASMAVSYTVENPAGIPGLPADGEEVGFTSDLGSRAVFGLGARLHLLLLNLSTQYTLDAFPTLSVKVGLGLP